MWSREKALNKDMDSNIWIINHYAELPNNGTMLRHYNFAKQLSKRGYRVKVFTSSAIHNSDYNSIRDNSKYLAEKIDDFEFIHIKTDNYSGNRLGRVKNIFQFYFGVMKNHKYFSHPKKPDIIYASSLHPLALLAGYQLSKKYNCRYIVEIRDLWPESVFIKRPNLNRKFIKPFYCMEKWFYKKADELIFTMEGGKDYIIEKGWDNEINLKKVHYINNGVCLEDFDFNKEQFRIDDENLLDENTYKIIFTGSIREIYDMPFLIETARILKKANRDDIKILVYGRGPLLKEYIELCDEEALSNIIFKGFVEKKYIPFILSKADCCLLHGRDSYMEGYGNSNNKLFEYFASGNPIISTLNFKYNQILKYGCGLIINNYSPNALYETICSMADEKPEVIKKFSNGSEYAAKVFDFENLTNKLIKLF